MRKLLVPFACLTLALAACSGLQTTITADVGKVDTAVTTFESKAAPVVANACATLHATESNPLAQIGIGGVTVALNVASGGAAGPVLASLKAFGDGFCLNGPPAGDTTTPAQQAAWLLNQVVAPMSAILSPAPAAAPAAQ